MASEMVRVRHPELKGEPLVPLRSLLQMDPRWEVVDDDQAAEVAVTPPAEAEEAPRRRRKEG